MYEDENGDFELCPPCRILSFVLYEDHFCNYGVKRQCSSRVVGYSEEGEFSIASLSGTYVTSMFCKGECEAGTFHIVFPF